jgi:hypothetical protein
MVNEFRNADKRFYQTWKINFFYIHTGLICMRNPYEWFSVNNFFTFIISPIDLLFFNKPFHEAI